jgi:Transposase IS116/IS110/IS902 family
LTEVVAVEKTIKDLTKELKGILEASGTGFLGLPGVGPIVAARVLTDVGDVSWFADRNRFAPWTGTAPIEASSGETVRHRLSRAGNRRMNHMIHIAATTQIDWTPRAAPTTGASSPMARLGWKPCAASSDGSPTPSIDSWSPMPRHWLTRVREGTAGRL